MDHAKLSPSSSSRWLTCTKSVEVSEQYPDNTNSAAEWGTLTHKLGELLLTGQQFPKTGEAIEDGNVRGTVDIEMMNTALKYAEYVREHIMEDSVTMIEERFDLSFIAPDTFGTSDATVLNDDHLHVMDLKTGRNIVMAKENTQLMLYALGALHALADNFDIDDVHDVRTVTLHIVQSRIGHIDTWSTTVADLLAFEKYARAQAEAIREGRTEYNPAEYACQWCPHKVNCEALAAHVDEIMDDAFEDLTADEVPEDHVVRMLKNAKLIRSYLDAVEDRALEMALNGKPVPGFKLVRKKKHLAWTDPERAEKYLLRKLRQDGTYSKKLITPTQAIRALDDKGRRFVEKNLAGRPEGEPVLAPLSDPREPVTAPADDFDDLDDEL